MYGVGRQCLGESACQLTLLSLLNRLWRDMWEQCAIKFIERSPVRCLCLGHCTVRSPPAALQELSGKLRVCVVQEKITKNVEREILNHYSLIHVRPLCEAACKVFVLLH